MKQIHRCLEEAEQNLHKVENREEHQEWVEELGATVDDLENWFDLVPTLEALLSDGTAVLDPATNHVSNCRVQLGALLGTLKLSGEKPGSIEHGLQQLASQVTAARSAPPAGGNQTENDLWLEHLDNCVAQAQKCWSVRPSAADPAQMTAALETIQTTYQPKLNSELAMLAKRLKADELSAAADEVLKSLRVDSTTIDTKYIKELKDTCARLICLVADHDGCQFADTALLATFGWTSVTTTKIKRWQPLREKLATLANRKPPRDGAASTYDEDRVKMGQKCGTLAETFEKAGDSDRNRCFDSFREALSNLFNRVDKELLKESNSLIEQAQRVGAVLEGYLNAKGIAA